MQIQINKLLKLPPAVRTDYLKITDKVLGGEIIVFIIGNNTEPIKICKDYFCVIIITGI